MKKLILLLPFALGACGLTPQGDFAREVVKERGADAADAMVDNSLWGLCNAATIGSIRREFGTSPDRANAYNRLCTPSIDIVSPIR